MRRILFRVVLAIEQVPLFASFEDFLFLGADFLAIPHPQLLLLSTGPEGFGTVFCRMVSRVLDEFHILASHEYVGDDMRKTHCFSRVSRMGWSWVFPFVPPRETEVSWEDLVSSENQFPLTGQFALHFLVHFLVGSARTTHIVGILGQNLAKLRAMQAVLDADLSASRRRSSPDSDPVCRRYASCGRFLPGNVQESEGRTGPSAETDSPMTPDPPRTLLFRGAERKEDQDQPMRLTREKTMRLSHVVTDVLVASQDVEFVEDRDTIRQKTVQILQDLLKEEEAVDAEIRKKISSRKRKSSKEAKSGTCSIASTTRKRCAAWASCTSRIPSHTPQRSRKRSNPHHRKGPAKMTERTYMFHLPSVAFSGLNTEDAEKSHREHGGIAGGRE